MESMLEYLQLNHIKLLSVLVPIFPDALHFISLGGAKCTSLLYKCIETEFYVLKMTILIVVSCSM
jgi:hypothetical protein